MTTISPDQLAAIRWLQKERKGYREFSHQSESPTERDIDSLLSHIDSQAAELAAMRKGAYHFPAKGEEFDPLAPAPMAWMVFTSDGGQQVFANQVEADVQAESNEDPDCKSVIPLYAIDSEKVNGALKIVMPDFVPVPASVLAAAGEALQNCLTIIDGEMPTRTDDDSSYANGVRVLESMKPYLPASNSPEK